MNKSLWEHKDQTTANLIGHKATTNGHVTKPVAKRWPPVGVETDVPPPVNASVPSFGKQAYHKLSTQLPMHK